MRLPTGIAPNAPGHRDDDHEVIHETLNTIVVDVRDYAEGWESDPTTLIQYAIDEAGAETTPGQIIQLPKAELVELEAQISVTKGDTVLRARGEQGTVIKAAGDFPEDTPLFKIGHPSSSGTVFGSRLERMQIHCNDRPGVVGVLLTNAQEGSGLHRVLVRNYTDAGVRLDGTGQTNKAAEVDIDGCQLWASEEGSNHGIDAVATAGGTYVSRTTVLALGGYASGIHGAALRSSGGQGLLSARDIHIEGYRKGLFADTDGYIRGDLIQGGNGPGTAGDDAMVVVGAFAGGAVLDFISNQTGNRLYVEREDLLLPAGITQHYEVRGYNVADEEVFIPATELNAVFGTPALVTNLGVGPLWSMPDGSASTVAGLFGKDRVPAHWAKFKVTARLCNLAASATGNFRLRPDSRFIAANGTLGGAGGAASEVSEADGTQYVMHDKDLHTITVASTDRAKMFYAAVTRRGDDGGNDTSSGAMGLVGLVLKETL